MLTSSHETRERDVSEDGVIEIVLLHAGEQHDVLFRLVVNDVHHVIVGNDADETPCLVHHRGGGQVVLAEHVGDLFLVGGHGNLVDIRVHEVGKLHRALGADDARQGDRADRAALGVDDENVDEIVGQVLGAALGFLAQVIDGVAHGPVGRQRHERALHQAPGGLLGQRQRFFEDGALVGVKLLQHLRLDRLVEARHHVHGVVGVELGDRRRDVGGTHLLDHVLAGGLLQEGQQLWVDAAARSGR